MAGQNFILFNVTSNGDLFSPAWKVSYKVLENPTKKAGEIPVTDDRKLMDRMLSAMKAKIVREQIMAELTKMLNVRANPYAIGFLSPEMRKDLKTAEMRMGTAEGITNFVRFCQYVNGLVLPILWDCKPTELSTRQKNYLKRYEAIKELCDAVEEKINNKTNGEKR